MSVLDREQQLHIQLQDPAEIYRVTQQCLADPDGGGEDGVKSAKIISFFDKEGLFSNISTNLVLYYPRLEHQGGFFINTFTEQHTAEQGCWSDEETRRLQAMLGADYGQERVFLVETEKDKFTYQHLFVIDPVEPARFVVALGSKGYHSFRSSIMMSLEAGRSQSLVGSLRQVFSLEDEASFIRRMEKGRSLLERTLNAMLEIKDVSQPVTITTETLRVWDFI